MATFVLAFVGTDKRKGVDLYRVMPASKSGDDAFVEATVHESFPSGYHILARCRRCHHFDCVHALFVQERVSPKQPD